MKRFLILTAVMGLMLVGRSLPRVAATDPPPVGGNCCTATGGYMCCFKNEITRCELSCYCQCNACSATSGYNWTVCCPCIHYDTFPAGWYCTSSQDISVGKYLQYCVSDCQSYDMCCYAEKSPKVFVCKMVNLCKNVQQYCDSSIGPIDGICVQVVECPYTGCESTGQACTSCEY